MNKAKLKLAAVEGLTQEELEKALELKQKQMKVKEEQLKNAPPDIKPLDWPRATERTTKSGETVVDPLVCIENTQALLKHYGAMIRYNEMSKDIEISIDEYFHRDTELNTKLTWITDKARIKGLRPTDIEEHVSFIASKNAYHPVRDWILSNEWDGTDRIEAFYSSIESNTDPAIKKLLMHRWAIMAIAAVFEQDGIRPQGVLTFEGAQGRGKTRWLHSIIGNSEWIAEGQALNPHDKDSVLDTVKKWIVELGEIQATFRRADIAALKGFITKNEDRVRPAYERKANTYARRTVFYGTVDESQFLMDKAGNRRFWTINVQSINTHHNIDVQQLWAQVYHDYKVNPKYWLEQEEIAMLNQHNEQFTVSDPVEQVLADRFCKGSQTRGKWMSPTEMLMLIYKGSKPSRNDVVDAARYLNKAQYKRRAKDQKFWVEDLDPVMDVIGLDGKTRVVSTLKHSGKRSLETIRKAFRDSDVFDIDSWDEANDVG